MFSESVRKRRRAGEEIISSPVRARSEPLESRRLLSESMVFITPPTTTVAGSDIDSPNGVQIEIEDSSGNPVNITESITISLSANPTGDTLHGSLTREMVNGIVTFPDLFLTKAATGYMLNAAETMNGAIASVNSAPFTITPGVPTQLVFTTPPASTTIGTTIDAPSGLAVTVEDSLGNTVTSNTDMISLSLSPNSSALIGAATAQASGGVAGFNNLSIFVSGVNYTLTATDASASLIATSQTFNVYSSSPYDFQNLASMGQDISQNGGFEPEASLYLDANGNIFGTTSTGGTYGDGIVFKIAEPGNIYSTLFSFTGTGGAYPGANPQAGLTSDGNGNLFGTTSRGGGSGEGTVFELAGPNLIFSPLLSFTGTTGADAGGFPVAGLTSDGNGNLFGTTKVGGAYNGGTVFELIGPNFTFSSLFSFPPVNSSYAGNSPVAGLTPDGNGNLLGTTSQGGAYNDGTVFELAGPDHTFSTTLSFGGVQYPGDEPQAPLSSDGNGNLFGTTSLGGASNEGTVFELAGPNYTFSSLLSFTGTSGTHPGAFPTAGLTFDGNGNLFGTTTSYSGGGSISDGTVFELAGANHTFSSLFSFTGSSGAYVGYEPVAGLTSDGLGNLFGTTEFGGSFNFGTLFELPVSSRGSPIDLLNFTGGMGYEPSGTVFIDSSGNLFGTTTEGGASNDGSVFEIAEPSGVYSTLISFTGKRGAYPGSYPEAGLVSDDNGNLFGTTQQGGTSNDGTVFELAGPNHTFSSLFSFTGSGGVRSGAYPCANLTSDGNGNLFGTTGGGGTSSDGTVFELAGPSHTFSSLLSFTGTNGANLGTDPCASLASDGNGNLFGTTYDGGTSNDGTVFELLGASHTFSSLFSFTGSSGPYPDSNPIGGLVPDGNGNLVGTTFGLQYYPDYGTVFELVGASHTYSLLVTFTGNSGAYPGANPGATLISDGHGNLLGVTEDGGSANGTVFELAGTNHTFSSLLSFTGDGGSYTGIYPTGLTSDGNGNLFGTTNLGGTFDDGTVFKLNLTTQLSFANPPSATTAGQTLPSFQVNVKQSTGIIATADSSIVTLSIQSGPTGATLGGTTSVQAVNGVATFTNLTLSIPGNYTLVATDGALSPATSPLTIQSINVTWTGAADGLNWSNPGNWSNDQVPTAYTDVTIASGFTVRVGPGTFSVDSLTTSSPIEITTGATLQLFGPTTFTSSLTVDTGGILKADADPVVLTVNGSSFTDNGTIDLGTNDMIIHNGNLTQITPNIFSSSASTSTTLAIELNNDGHGNPLMTTFDGQTVTTSDVLVKYTYYGDADLSGSVTAADYIAIDNGFNSQSGSHPLTGWNNGDFNNDGKINGDDYTLIDNAFNTQAATPLATVASPPATSQLQIRTVVTKSPTIAIATSQSLSQEPFDPLHRRKPSLANEIFTD